MTILGYGEDALTFHALTKGLSQFLDKLGDPTPLENVTVFFRPSFGRRSTRAGAGGSQFGEFDAIVGTDMTIYLVEAKWDRSGELRGDELKLRNEQTRRHQAMKAYFEAAFEVRESGDEWSWSTLKTAVTPRLAKKTIGLAVPNEKTILQSNLDFVLRRLTDQKRDVHDVLLFLHNDPILEEVKWLVDGFKVVPLYCKPVEDSRFVEMGSAPVDSRA